MADAIADLTDDELREQLTGYGVNVGPIVSSTRLFYEKKLGKLIEAGGVPAQPDTEESEEEEEEEDEEEVQFNYRQQEESFPRPPARPQYTSTPVTQTQNYTPVTQARVATPTTATRRVIPSRTNERPSTAANVPEKQSKGGISIWIKLLLVVVLAFLVYLVIINMNPSAQNKIPLTYDDSV